MGTSEDSDRPYWLMNEDQRDLKRSIGRACTVSDGSSSQRWVEGPHRPTNEEQCDLEGLIRRT